jgi:hypothetical protein
MPLCFWAAQTSVAASDLGVGISRLVSTTYLPPHTAATAIQRAYHSHVVDTSYDYWEWQINLTVATSELERIMSRARWDLGDDDNFVFLFSSLFSTVIWSGHLDNG